MNDIVKTDIHLPNTIEDLSKFVLVNEERVQALRAQIRAIKKVNLAKDVYEQKLAEAQEVGEIVVEAGRKMGELLLTIQKQSGKRTDMATSSEGANEVKTKTEIISDMGMKKTVANEYQQMAQNPEAVQKAIEKAIENGDVVSRSQVMKEIRALKEELRKAKEQKPEIKEVIREVVPSDYREAKNKAKAYDAETRRLNKRLEDAYKERNYLQDRVAELEGATKEGLDTSNLSENVFYFCTICNNFIGNVGGLVWLTDRIADMPEKQRDMFLKASNSFRDWSLAFTQNLERRVNEYEQTAEFDSRVPVLTDKESRRQD